MIDQKKSKAEYFNGKEWVPITPGMVLTNDNGASSFFHPINQCKDCLLVKLAQVRVIE